MSGDVGSSLAAFESLNAGGGVSLTELTSVLSRGIKQDVKQYGEMNNLLNT